MLPNASGRNFADCCLLVIYCNFRVRGFSNQQKIQRVLWTRVSALSFDYIENDLVAVALPGIERPRFSVVRPDGTVSPLCQHEGDVELDLFVDTRHLLDLWKEITDEAIVGQYGEAWYGQRPVPSLGGGLGYGASADENEILDRLQADGVDLPTLDIGMAHGEKARGGVY